MLKFALILWPSQPSCSPRFAFSTEVSRYLLVWFFSHREPKLDWANDMALPVRFSIPTTKAIETGILTKSARVEIVHSLSTLILMHTSRPTPHDMDTISRRLVTKHPRARKLIILQCDEAWVLEQGQALLSSSAILLAICTVTIVVVYIVLVSSSEFGSG